MNISDWIKIRGMAEHVIAGEKIVIESRNMIDPEAKGKFIKR